MPKAHAGNNDRGSGSGGLALRRNWLTGCLISSSGLWLEHAVRSETFSLLWRRVATLLHPRTSSIAPLAVGRPRAKSSDLLA